MSDELPGHGLLAKVLTASDGVVAGTREDHINALIEVKNEFMKPPHPAWTAVGTTGLLEPTGLVEIQLIAHIPPTGAQ